MTFTRMSDVTTKPDPLMSASYGATDIEAQNNRNTWMTMLYLHEGRDKADHPQRGLYTGLFKKHHLWLPGSDEN